MSSQDAEAGHSHEPVLLAEILDWLRPERGGIFVDCTLGLGGHSEALLKASPDAQVIGLDRDREAIAIAEQRLSRFENRFRAVHANFADVQDALTELGVSEAEGVMADLGVSSLQLDQGERGFSFLSDAVLDMRMDRSADDTAADLVKQLTEQELADVIFEYGEERGARKIARAIARERARAPIETTKQLADIVIRALRIPGRWRIHPATRTFQALRIAVNQELRALERFIPEAISRLSAGSRLAIISFHSLEDRIVKRSLQRESGRCDCPAGRNAFGFAMPVSTAPTSDEVICRACGARRRVAVLTRKPVRPSQAEVDRNPRSRSALLRVCERL
jgi:16S rRNA (cytosine1402-N4)-methyltransferase